MAQSAQGDTGLLDRNTNRGSGRNRSRTVCGEVWDVSTEAQQKIIDFSKEHGAIHLVFQSEKGEKEGNLHLQWTMHFKNPRDVNKLRSLWPFPKGWEFDKAKKNVWAAINYCCKEKTRYGGIRYDMRNGKILVEELGELSEEKTLIKKPKLTYEEWSGRLLNALANDKSFMAEFHEFYHQNDSPFPKLSDRPECL